MAANLAVGAMFEGYGRKSSKGLFRHGVTGIFVEKASGTPISFDARYITKYPLGWDAHVYNWRINAFDVNSIRFVQITGGTGIHSVTHERVSGRHDFLSQAMDNGGVVSEISEPGYNRYTNAGLHMFPTVGNYNINLCNNYNIYMHNLIHWGMEEFVSKHNGTVHFDQCFNYGTNYGIPTYYTDGTQNYIQNAYNNDSGINERVLSVLLSEDVIWSYESIYKPEVLPYKLYTTSNVPIDELNWWDLVSDTTVGNVSFFKTCIITGLAENGNGGVKNFLPIAMGSLSANNSIMASIYEAIARGQGLPTSITDVYNGWQYPITSSLGVNGRYIGTLTSPIKQTSESQEPSGGISFRYGKIQGMLVPNIYSPWPCMDVHTGMGNTVKTLVGHPSALFANATFTAGAPIYQPSLFLYV